MNPTQPRRTPTDDPPGNATPDVLLTPPEAADHLRIPVRQLQQWRYLRRGPAYCRVGRAVRYRRSDLDAYVSTRRVEPEGA